MAAAGSGRRLAWFAGLWLAGAVGVGTAAYLLRALLLAVAPPA